MAKSPTSVEIRSYQVGFGDCFLLSFVYSESDKRHVLIDFGTTGLPRSGKPSVHMPKVAKDIREVCRGGKLVAVVATHRHADHISGFSTEGKGESSGDIIKGLEPKVVIQPWTEDPDAAEDATSATQEVRRTRASFIGGLRAMNDVARAVRAIAARPAAWMTTALQKELSFLGMDNIANKSAVDNLIAMGRRKGATAVFAHHGSRSGLERRLPGVKVRVLGPPDLTQTQKIRKQTAKDADEFWHLLAGAPAAKTRMPMLDGLRDSPRGRDSSGMPPAARWFQERLDRMRGEQLLQIVRELDDQMNNTSLILLFEVWGKKLLFPGDAQLENWTYALKDAPDSAATRALLADVDVYKVGHHGSLNATPRKMLWENFRKRDTNATGKPKLQTLLSTMPGKHGKTASKTEVPRRTLLAALETETELYNTDRLPAAEPCNRVVITR